MRQASRGGWRCALDTKKEGWAGLTESDRATEAEAWRGASAADGTMLVPRLSRTLNEFMRLGCSLPHPKESGSLRRKSEIGVCVCVLPSRRAQRR
jgi:hypothetical protein